MKNVREANFSTTSMLAKDPETKFTQKGDAFVKFSLPCDVGYGDNKETLWVNCAYFGKGDYAAKQTAILTKGFIVSVRGVMGMPYVNESGVASLNVNVTEIGIAGWPKDYVKGQGKASQSTPAPAQEEEEIPF